MFETELQMQKEFVKLLNANKKQHQNILEESNVFRDTFQKQVAI